MARGSVVARNGGWTAIYDEPRPDGKRRQRWKSGFKSKKAAESYLREQLGKIDRNDYTAPTRITVATFLDEKWLPSLDLRPSTRDSYTRIVEGHLVPALGGYQLAKLGPERIGRLYRELGEAGLSAKTIRNVHGVLRTALGAAVAWDYISRNPADRDRIKPPKLRSVRARNRDRVVWSPAELGTFLAFVRDDPLFAAWRLLATTGLRRGELLGLRWADVNLDAGSATIRAAAVVVNYRVVISETKTEAGERTLSLDAETVSALRTHHDRQAFERIVIGPRWVDSRLVFTRPDGSPIHPQRFSSWFEQRAKAAGLPRIRLHDVRHSYITAGLLAGVPMKVMSERAGHANQAITADLYSHVLAEMDASAAEKVAAVIDGAG